MVGTGVAGGLSTFSSFAYGAVVLIRFGGKRSCLRLRLKQLVPRLSRRSLRPTGCEAIVPLSRIVGSQGCRFEACLRSSGGFHLPNSREHERVTVFHLDIIRESFRPTLCAIHRNRRLESGLGVS
jgi:hypothetical protein